MRRKTVVVALCAAAAVLSGAAAGASLIWDDTGAPVVFTTARDTSVRLQGHGLYAADSVFAAAGFRAQDTVTLVVALPLLGLLAWHFWYGRARATPLLLGVLAYELYVSASMAIGAAYNPLFLAYVGGLSASLFAFVLVFTAPLELRRWPARREAAAFMFAAGVLTFFVWVSPLVDGLAHGRPPALLDHYTTLVTPALDLAIVTPAAFVSGVLILRRDLNGYRIACALIGLVSMLAPIIALSTINQLRAGVSFSLAELAGPVAGFLVLGSTGLWILRRILGGIEVFAC
jgi:hypothetical protein